MQQQSSSTIRNLAKAYLRLNPELADRPCPTYLFEQQHPSEEEWKSLCLASKAADNPPSLLSFNRSERNESVFAAFIVDGTDEILSVSVYGINPTGYELYQHDYWPAEFTQYLTDEEGDGNYTHGLVSVLLRAENIADLAFIESLHDDMDGDASYPGYHIFIPSGLFAEQFGDGNDREWNTLTGPVFDVKRSGTILQLSLDGSVISEYDLALKPQHFDSKRVGDYAVELAKTYQS